MGSASQASCQEKILYHYVEPEVAGAWGNETIADTSVHPPVVHKLHYEISGWLGDDLLETFPCFIVSERLREDLIKSGLAGFDFDHVLISKSDELAADTTFEEMPNFHWMKVHGANEGADFKISADHRLMVSDRALTVLRRNKIANAEISSA